MTFQDVTTKTDGSTGLSAKEYNQFIKDNFAAGIPDIFTTKGDIAVATASNVAARLGVGTNDAVLWADSGQSTGLVWGINSKLRATSTTQVNNNTKLTFYLVQFNAETFDTGSVFTNHRFTAIHPGYYLVLFLGNWDKRETLGGTDISASENENLYFCLYKNGTIYSRIAGEIFHNSGISHYSMTWGGDIVSMLTGDYLEIYSVQNLYAGMTQFYTNGYMDANRFHISIVPLI